MHAHEFGAGGEDDAREHGEGQLDALQHVEPIRRLVQLRVAIGVYGQTQRGDQRHTSASHRAIPLVQTEIIECG